jgi:hypothetical protein
MCDQGGPGLTLTRGSNSSSNQGLTHGSNSNWQQSGLSRGSSSSQVTAHGGSSQDLTATREPGPTAWQQQQSGLDIRGRKEELFSGL